MDYEYSRKGQTQLIVNGTIAEHKIMSELLKRDWSVYNNICDVNGIDLIISKQGKLLRVQVKSNSKLHFKKHKKGRGHYVFQLKKKSDHKTPNHLDFAICDSPTGIYVIPSSIFKNKMAITVYPNQSQFFKTGYVWSNYLENWSLLDKALTSKQVKLFG